MLTIQSEFQSSNSAASDLIMDCQLSLTFWARVDNPQRDRVHCARECYEGICQVQAV